MALLLALVLSLHSYLPADSSATSLWGMGGIFVIGACALLVGVVAMLFVRRGSRAFFAGATVATGAAPAPAVPWVSAPAVAAND